MKKHNINRWYFEIPLSDVQAEGLGTIQENRCFLCGKKLRAEKYFVHYLTNGNLLSTDEEPANSQGFFPIGTECAGKLPNNFVFSAE